MNHSIIRTSSSRCFLSFNRTAVNDSRRASKGEMNDDDRVRIIKLIQTQEIAYRREVVTEYHYPLSNGDLARLKFTHTRSKDRKRNFILPRDPRNFLFATRAKFVCLT